MRGGVSYPPYLIMHSRPVSNENVPVCARNAIRDNRVATRRDSQLRRQRQLHLPAEHPDLDDAWCTACGAPNCSTNRSRHLIRRCRRELQPAAVSRPPTARVNYTFRRWWLRLNSVRRPRSRLHDFEFGYDLDVAHSPTRRTTISFSGGPSHRRLSGASGGSSLRRRHPGPPVQSELESARASTAAV